MLIRCALIVGIAVGLIACSDRSETANDVPEQAGRAMDQAAERAYESAEQGARRMQAAARDASERMNELVSEAGA